MAFYFKIFITINVLRLTTLKIYLFYVKKAKLQNIFF